MGCVINEFPVWELPCLYCTFQASSSVPHFPSPTSLGRLTRNVIFVSGELLLPHPGALGSGAQCFPQQGPVMSRAEEQMNLGNNALFLHRCPHQTAGMGKTH